MASAAVAQDSNAYRVRVSVGARLQPKFVGSDSSGVSPIVQAKIARGTNAFRFTAPDDRFGIALVSKDGFSAGPAANLAWKRKESDVGARVGNVPLTIEAGGFVQYDLGSSLRVRGELVKGLNGHKGLVGTVGVDRIWRDGDRYVFSIGPRVLFGDARYERAYFGVSPTAAINSGLPAYRPGGGVYGVAMTSSATYQVNSQWGLFGFARYERLTGDAARSPIVRDLGSRNQLSGGVGVSYTFVVHR